MFEIADLDVGKVDASDGFRPGRDRIVLPARVHGFPRWRTRAATTASAYFGNSQEERRFHTRASESLILAGASHWHLSEEYIRELEQIEVSE